MLADPGPAVERCPEGIVARTWRTPDGKVHILVCNTLREPVSGTVSFGGQSLAVDLPPMGVDFRQMLNHSSISYKSHAETQRAQRDRSKK